MISTLLNVEDFENLVRSQVYSIAAHMVKANGEMPPFAYLMITRDLRGEKLQEPETMLVAYAGSEPTDHSMEIFLGTVRDRVITHEAFALALVTKAWFPNSKCPDAKEKVLFYLEHVSYQWFSKLWGADVIRGDSVAIGELGILSGEILDGPFVLPQKVEVV